MKLKYYLYIILGIIWSGCLVFAGFFQGAHPASTQKVNAAPSASTSSGMQLINKFLAWRENKTKLEPYGISYSVAKINGDYLTVWVLQDKALRKAPDLVKNNGHIITDDKLSFMSNYPVVTIYYLTLSRLAIIVPRVMNDNKNIKKLNIVVLLVGTDKYGNKMLYPPLFKAVLAREVFNKINWSGFDYTNFPNVFSELYAGNELQYELNELTKQ